MSQSAYVCALLGIFGLLCSPESPAQAIYVKAGKLFDSQNARLMEEQTVVVEGNRILSVESAEAVPDTVQVIDLSEYTLFPGLIDAHTHLLYLESPKEDLALGGIKAIVMEGDALRSLRGAARARTFLEAGITTVKDLGNSGMFLDVALKQAIQEGSVEGPRMFVSGPIISSEGGQIPGLLREHGHLAEQEYRVVRGVEDARNAVRENVTYGADLIKICANNTPNNTTLTVEEMKAIVEMAHRYRRKVTAHATSNQAVWEAVVAGVDGIEHGYQIADTTLQLMAERGVYLVPTDISRDQLSRYLELMEYEGNIDEAIQGYTSGMHDRLQRAIKAGVTIVAGSDMYIDLGMPQGKGAKEVLVAYTEAGMNPLDVLQAATYHSAQAMGRERELGVLQPEAYADMVAVRGDLEENFSQSLFDIVLVMKDGKVVWSDLESPSARNKP